MKNLKEKQVYFSNGKTCSINNTVIQLQRYVLIHLFECERQLWTMFKQVQTSMLKLVID